MPSGDGVATPSQVREIWIAELRGLLEATLEETDGNVSAAARMLDITRSHFYTLMRAHGVEPQR